MPGAIPWLCGYTGTRETRAPSHSSDLMQLLTQQLPSSSEVGEREPAANAYNQLLHHVLSRSLLLLNTSAALLNPSSTPQGRFPSLRVPCSAPHTHQETRGHFLLFCPPGFRCRALTFPKSVLPGRQASLTRTPFPSSLLNPYCCLGERVGLRDSREQSRRGHDPAIITSPWGREGTSLGFQSPFESVLYVLYIKHLSEKKTQRPGKRTRSHIFSS